MHIQQRVERGGGNAGLICICLPAVESPSAWDVDMLSGMWRKYVLHGTVVVNTLLEDSSSSFSIASSQ